MFCIDFVGLFGSLFKLSIYETRTEQQENSCPERSYLFQKKNFRAKSHHCKITGGKFLFSGFFLDTEKSFLSQEIIFCHGNKLPVLERNFPSQKEISCLRKKFPDSERNFLSQKEISSLRKKSHCPRKKNSGHRKKFLVTGRNS